MPILLVGAMALGLAGPDVEGWLPAIGSAALLAAVVLGAVFVHELLHGAAFVLQGVPPKFDRDGGSFRTFGPGLALSRAGSLAVLLLPYILLLPSAAAVAVLADGTLAWLGWGVVYGQVVGATYDMYAAWTVARSPSGTRWADTHDALVAVGPA